jgi:hypothetical protein
MEYIQAVERHLGPVGDEQRAYNRAAYLLGHHVQLMAAWLTAVHDIAANPERPWSWDCPFTIFGASFDSAPLGLVTEVNEALRILVGMGAVDGARLVELHRALDSAAAGCLAVAELAKRHQRDEICECYWDVSDDLTSVTQLEEQLLTGNFGALDAWRQFGDLLGRLLHWQLSSEDYLEISKVVTRFLELGRRLLPPARIDPVADLFSPVGVPASLAQIGMTSGKLIAPIRRLDYWVYTELATDFPAEPYVVLDDKLGLIVFLGAAITFKDFAVANATGGLALLRVLIDRPGSPVKSSDLVELAGLVLEPNGVSTYFSRFRKVIRTTESQWPREFKSGREHARAKHAFILPDHLAKKLAVDKTDSWYKFDLPAHQVQHIQSR